MCQARAKVRSLRLAQALHKVLERLTLHAGHALGADFLLVRKDAHGSLSGAFRVEDRGKLCIGANSVVVPVGADHAAVQTDIARVRGRNRFQLGGDEVLLDDAVFFVQKPQHRELHAVLAVVVRFRTASH